MAFDDQRGGGDDGGGSGRPWYSVEDATAVLYFLRQAEIEGDFYQLVEAREAFEAACRIMLLDPEHVRNSLGLDD